MAAGAPTDRDSVREWPRRRPLWLQLLACAINHQFEDCLIDGCKRSHVLKATNILVMQLTKSKESGLKRSDLELTSTPTDATLERLLRAHFAVSDVLRRVQGDTFEAFGLGPSECPYWVVASNLYWRLRAHIVG